VEAGGKSRRLQMVDLVIAYRRKLNAAIEIYDRQDKSNSQNAKTIRHVLDHLFWVITKGP
jgi:hypothetical protein